jgi:hypothetical protein
MAIEIYSVTGCKKHGKNWLIDAHIIDLETKEFQYKNYPIAGIPRLPIGAEINSDHTVKRSAGKPIKIHFPDFEQCKIITINELQEELYSFQVDDSVKENTKLLSVKNGNLTYVFFCYEIFRALLCMDNRLTKFLFQYNVLESFIDYEDITDENGLIEATIEVNEMFPRSFLSNSLLEKFILLVYNQELSSLRKSIQSHAMNGESDFSFSTFPFKNLSLTCQIKEYKTFKLIYYINSIDSPIDFPFDQLKILHPQMRSKSQENQEKNTQAGKMPIKHATSHETSDTEGGNKDSQEDLNVLPLEYKFNRKVLIEKVKLNKRETQDDGVISTKIPEHILSQLNLSLLEEDDHGQHRFLSLNRDRDIASFDFAEIPAGLIPFAKAVKILADTINKAFTYWISEFTTKSSFKYLNGGARKAIVVKFDLPSPIYFIEIDSSDERYISTLILFQINTPDHKKYINVILNTTANNQGRWPEKEMSRISGYITLRHPKELKDNDLSEARKEELYIDRIAGKFLNAFSA